MERRRRRREEVMRLVRDRRERGAGRTEVEVASRDDRRLGTWGSLGMDLMDQLDR